MVLETSYSPKHLAQSLNWEPQRVYNYQLEITDAGLENVMLAIVNFSLPNVTNEPISIKHGNTDVKFAGSTQWQGSDTLTVIDYVDTDIGKIIWEWRRSVYDPQTDKIGWAARYKKTGKVTEFAPDATAERMWMYEGLWPSAVEYGELNHEQTGDIRRINVTIQYDRAYRI